MLMRALIILAASVLMQPSAAFPCAVVAGDTLKAKVQEADVTFVGRVVAFDNAVATLQVVEHLKGPTRPIFNVRSESNCDYGPYEVGKLYFINARDVGPILITDIGSYTTEVTPTTQRRVRLVRDRINWWMSKWGHVTPWRNFRLRLHWWRVRLSEICQVCPF